MKKIVMSLSTIIALSSFLSAGTYGNQYNSYDGNLNSDGPDTELGMVVDVPEIVYEKDSSYEGSSFWTDEGSGFYLSGAYAYTSVEEDLFISDGTESFSGDIDETGNGWMFAAGYDFNKYFGIEARYNGVAGISKETVLTSSSGATLNNNGAGEMDISNFAGYFKGSLPISDDFSIYGLVGYGVTSWNMDESTDYTILDSESGFQYGGGLKYSFSESFSVFVDYTLLYDDKLSGRNSSSNWSEDVTIYSVNAGISYKF
jgi:opacity protein-like surface antigen